MLIKFAFVLETTMEERVLNNIVGVSRVGAGGEECEGEYIKPH